MPRTVPNAVPAGRRAGGRRVAGCVVRACPAAATTGVASLWREGRPADAPSRRRRSHATVAFASSPDAENGPAAEDAPANDVGSAASSKDDGEMSFVAQFFGTYLQVGVWITVLSLAGFKGAQTALAGQDMSEMGLLIAPTSAALFLIGTFLAYNNLAGKAKE